MEAIRKRLDAAKEFFAGHKKQIITTAVTAVACLLVIGVSNAGAGIFSAMELEASEALVSLKNEKENFIRSDRMFTSQEEILKGDDVEIKYVGNGVDGGRWRTDEDFFWEFIKPAFNYDRASEYNKTREDYVNKLGTCLFTAQFMAYYDIPGKAMEARATQSNPKTGELTEAELSQADNAFRCVAQKSNLITFPVGVTADGDYEYAGFVGMSRNGKVDDTIMVGFTYTVVHGVGEGGTERLSITNFSCWPPHSRNPLSNQTLNAAK